MELIVRSEFVAAGDKLKQQMQSGYGQGARKEIRNKLRYYRMMRQVPDFSVWMPHPHYFVPKGHWVEMRINRNFREESSIVFAKSTGEFWGILMDEESRSR